MYLILQLVAGVAVLIAFLTLVCWALARSGWKTLATEFRINSRPHGRVLRFASGRVGTELITGGLTVIAADEGLWLGTSLLWLRVPFHPPLLIPWSSISPDGSGKSRHEFPLQIDAASGRVALELDGAAGRAVWKEIESHINHDAATAQR